MKPDLSKKKKDIITQTPTEIKQGAAPVKYDKIPIEILRLFGVTALCFAIMFGMKFLMDWIW